MSLKKKTLLILTVTASSLLAILYIFWRSIFLGNLLEVEEANHFRTLKQVKTTFEKNMIIRDVWIPWVSRSTYAR
ncbi:hypothetical protein BHU72_02035 [Desulfuribacillus stibiiarsenatis]|uniref:Uncharacterized protein n=1 Tax=Desulfuribacillus stibiiarsenatis TaxID=1390249 RepID=A0A1E5L621_9FIRM|nr:hypothetical protein [Desulfuribacillus stibiiarsenatis]OEH85602.1 hypothetical protein BHU72_02035 [Desulfuribacillus stibiiarsenatis]